MTGRVRQPIDGPSLSAYIACHIPDIRLPLSISQFKYGQSNPTYLLEASDGSRYVLRKKPPGKLLSKTAHQVEREFRVLSALQGSGVPVPKVYGLCLDITVLGSQFYVMEYLEGRIFADPALPGISPSERQQMWHCALHVLGHLHSVRPEAVALNDFGKAGGFYDRQLRTLGTIAASQASTLDVDTAKPVGDMPHAKELIFFLGSHEHQPHDRSCLIHGDYKIDNLVFHPTQPRIIGILDWEMSTIGHPLSDLSNLLSPYIFAVNPPNAAMQVHCNSAFVPGGQWSGLLSQAQCLKAYSQYSGWDASSDIAWGGIFATFRNGVIMQGIAARRAQRQATSEEAQRFEKMMKPNGEFCWGLVQQYLANKRDAPEGSKL